MYIADIKTDKWTKLSKVEDFIYGISINHKQTKMAYHNASQGYTINVMDLDGNNLKYIMGKERHIFCFPVWSPDDKWLAYQDCNAKDDLGHYFTDLCIWKPDGSKHRVITNGQSQYFATAHGTKEHRRGGANCVTWIPDGRYLLYTKRSSGAHPDASFHAELADHQEYMFCPECAKGGSSLILLDSFSGKEMPVIKFEEGKWDFEGSISPDGKKLVYVTAKVGNREEIRICDLDGSNDKFLTAGADGIGADYPIRVESVLVQENSPLTQ